MPKLIVQNLFERAINVPPSQKVLDAIQAAGLDWMKACGGKGRCTTYRLIVIKGMEGFGALSLPEQKYQENGRLNANERLACQSYLRTDVIVKVPSDTQFPHLIYSH
ncbi:2Fe-2S iron-sulfur cluster-binding protein [Adhaeribacter aquaticus]|uniref:2Fe-2S iron-sulfur cluster-binding protein n=1 Tax=Adhaeribacter aquaticus TaxID=299567 RepID=UPI000415CDC3|nr:2Fe-2S iron-sulfur cluster-binding protein [Adhaeribacter aquaticus]